jgi:hypothetical protein
MSLLLLFIGKPRRGGMSIENRQRVRRQQQRAREMLLKRRRKEEEFIMLLLGDEVGYYG